jgi:hypothetical protein
MTPELKRFIYRSWLFFGSLTVLIILIVKLWPASEILLFQEDGFIESGTAIIDGIAAILGFYAIYLGVAKGRSMLDRLAIWTIPVLSAICALDEISWGARLFDLQMPEMKGGGEFDGIHDVFVILQRLVGDAEPSSLFAAVILLAAMLAVTVYWQRTFITACLKYSMNTRLGRPLASAIALLAFATLLDFGHNRIISSLEEYAEISAGLFLLLAAYSSLRMAYAAQKEPAGSAYLNQART